ncbi:MAG: glycosyltransferase, partial [Dehalococcoidia bacterium]
MVPLGPGAEPSAEPTPEAELRSRFGHGSGPIVLSVGPVRAHKNLESLVEAAPLVKERNPEATFVLAGGFTGHLEALLGRAAELGVENEVRLPGWVDEADLEGLYRCAACFVLPSLNEGFGLPILEAMRRGVPAAC